MDQRRRAYQRACYVDVAGCRVCLNAFKYLSAFGRSGEQTHVILTTAPLRGRIAGGVDIPNVCAKLAIPTAILDVDIRPNSDGRRNSVVEIAVAKASWQINFGPR